MSPLPDFQSFDFTAEGSTRTIFHKGNGPAVVLMHELPGMIPDCVALADRIAAAGFTVYLPLLFGEPNVPLSLGTLAKYTVQLCLSKEISLLAKNQSSPITTWLKALCREAKARCKGRGTSEGMIYGAFIRLMLRRFDKSAASDFV